MSNKTYTNNELALNVVRKLKIGFPEMALVRDHRPDLVDAVNALMGMPLIDAEPIETYRTIAQEYLDQI
jgi:hypothetical protein